MSTTTIGIGLLITGLILLVFGQGATNVMLIGTLMVLGAAVTSVAGMVGYDRPPAYHGRHRRNTPGLYPICLRCGQLACDGCDR